MSDVQDETPSSWTVDTLRVFLSAKISDLHDMLQERYEQQTKAVDAAFSSQQIAMQVAKTEQATAMQTALAVQKEAVNTAMAAADKATAKAEISSDKRFEAVNEFRAQLGDQAATFATRNDLELRINAVNEKLGYESQRFQDSGVARDKQISDMNAAQDKAMSDMNLRLTTQLAGRAGQDIGSADSRTNKRLDTSQIISFISLFLVFVSIAITLITVFSK